MTEQQQKQLALETYDLVVKRLHARRPNLEVEKHDKDPAFIPKGKGKDVMRVRVFPKKRLPKHFWNVDACFYEIGVGPYEGRAFCLGGVQFFQYAKQQRCGGGSYETAIESILRSLLPTAPKGFFFEPPSIERKFHFEKQYSGKDYGPGVLFPCKDAANDLAWLIEQSLPKFFSL
jgi:hypothetical protein